MKKDTKGLLWGALVGTVVGSVTALLFAPKPGKELRKDIADGTAAGIEKVHGIAVQAGDKSVELYDKAKDSIVHVVHEVREWGKSSSDEVEEEIAVVAVSGIEAEAEAEVEDTTEAVQEAAATSEEATELEASTVIDEDKNEIIS